jgi:hypothetical protein
MWSARIRTPPSSTTIGAYWTAFALTGDPNGVPPTDGKLDVDGGARAMQMPRWPAFNQSEDAALLLDTPQPAVERGYRADACAQWQQIGNAHVSSV